MPCYTHKMAIVSWPYILWRHFTLHIQWERLSTVQPTIGPRTAEDKTRQNKTKYCYVFAMKLFAALNSEYRILSETAGTTTHCHLLSRLSSESFFATDVSFLILGGSWSGTTRVGRYQKKHSLTHIHPDHRTSFINFRHLFTTIHSILFVQFTCLTVLFDHFCPRPLWSSSWSWTLNFILHRFLHSIIIFFSQHMPISTQPGA